MKEDEGRQGVGKRGGGKVSGRRKGKEKIKGAEGIAG